MAKGARPDAKRASAHEARRKWVRVYTAWHPLLVVLLEHALPAGWYQCLSELQLAREPLRVDVVIIRRSRQGRAPAPHLLNSVLADLAEHTLVHFKGPTDGLERDDARMLLAYALQYLVVARIEDPAEIALRVVAPALTPRFEAALRSLGCVLTKTAPGTHEGRLLVFPLRVVESARANARAGEHLLYTVAPGMVVDPSGIPALSTEEVPVFWALLEHVEQHRHALPGQRKRQMKDEDKVVESWERAMKRVLARMPPERYLAGLAPEQRLAGLPAEQRLAGLTEAQAVLALPDTMLRALSADYLAKLPAETQAEIQRRLAGKAARTKTKTTASAKKRAPSRRPARGRKR